MNVIIQFPPLIYATTSTMTILPKKKSSQARPETENSPDGSTLQHLSVGSTNHLSHIGPVPQVLKCNISLKQAKKKLSRLLAACCFTLDTMELC